MDVLVKAKPGLFHGCTFFQARVASSSGRSLTCRISTCNYMPCLAHTGNAAQSSRITRLVHLSNICHLTQLPIDRALSFWVLGYTVMSHFRTCRAACTSFGGSPTHSREYFLELTILGFLPIPLVTISFHIQNMSGLSAKSLAGENRPLRRPFPEHEPSFRQSLPKSKHIFQIWIWYGGQHCKHGHTLPSCFLILNISRSLGIR